MDGPSTGGDAAPGLAGARPGVTADEVAVVAQARWRLGAFVRELGSHQDRNFLFESPAGRVVVKVANSAWPREALEAQIAAMTAAAASEAVVPTLVQGVVPERFGDGEYLVHVVTFVEGEPLFDRSDLGPSGYRPLGTAAGEMVRALSGFAHPGAVRATSATATCC
jgi:Ser/Thr protein kinase RdoA (MazF antagonist)